MADQGFIVTPSSAPVQMASVAQSAGTVVPSAKLPGPIVILKSAWRIYVNRFWTLFCISLVPLILVGVLVAVGTGLAVGVGAAVTGGSFGLSLNAGAALDVSVVLLAALAYIVIIYVSVWSGAAQMFAVKGAGQMVGFKQSFHAASHKIGSLFGALVLVVAIVFLCAAACVFGFGILYALEHAFFPSTAASFILGMLAVVSTCAAVLVLGVRYSLASYIVVGDDVTAMSAVKRSRDYVRGYWWPVFWRFVFLVVMAAVFTLAVFLLVALLGFLLKGAGLVGTILVLIVQEFLTLALSLLYVVYAYQVYANLKAVKGESQVPADRKASGWIALAVVLGFILLLCVPVALLALNAARSKSRDALRAADAREVSTALSLYKYDKGFYPSDLSQLVPGYIGTLPTAPTPPDGSCTAAQNTYTYTLVSPTDYTFTFCTGGSVGGYGAGPHTETEGTVNGAAAY